jgi:hypothetical protein
MDRVTFPASLLPVSSNFPQACRPSVARWLNNKIWHTPVCVCVCVCVCSVRAVWTGSVDTRHTKLHANSDYATDSNLCGDLCMYYIELSLNARWMKILLGCVMWCEHYSLYAITKQEAFCVPWSLSLFLACSRTLSLSLSVSRMPGTSLTRSASERTSYSLPSSGWGTPAVQRHRRIPGR